MSLWIEFIGLKKDQIIPIYSDLGYPVNGLTVSYDSPYEIAEILEKIKINCTKYNELFNIGTRQDFTWSKLDIQFMGKFCKDALSEVDKNKLQLQNIVGGRTVETEYEWAKSFLIAIQSMCQQALKYNVKIGFNQ